MRRINFRRSVNENMSVTDYENKIKNLSNSSELDNILMDYDLPTDEGDFSDLIRQWFDYQYYIDDPQGYDAALAYYYSKYGDNSVFQTAIKDAIQNMKDNGFADVNEGKPNKHRTKRLFEKFRRKVLEELSTDAYYEKKVQRLIRSNINLEKELKEKFGLPTSQDELSTLIKNWFDYQDYSDDEQAFDYAMAYYLSEYGNDNVFRNALEDVIDNMEANGYTEIYEKRRKLSESIRNRRNKRKTFENFRKMKRNKKVTYRVNESSQRKRFKRLPMFENYLEEKYDSVKLLDGHKYTLTGDVVAEDGQTLAKKGDTVTYEDVVGVFTNNATEFTTDCGVFRTEDGQALQPEILMSQNLLSDPQSKMTEDPKAFMTEVVAECRKVGQKLGKAAATRKKIYESLTDEQKKKYQAKKEKLTSEQIEKYNKEIDDMEAKAQKLYQDMEDGKITQEEMMKKTDRLTKSALEKYRTVTGGEDPAWYEDYMDEPGFGKANEDDFYYIAASENADELDEMLQFCSENGFELPKDKIIDGTIDIEFARNEAGNYVDFRVYDPSAVTSVKDKNSDGWSSWLLGKHQPINEDLNWTPLIHGSSERRATFFKQFAPYRDTMDWFYEKFWNRITCDKIIAKINDYVNDPYVDDISVYDIKELVKELHEIVMDSEDLVDIQSKLSYIFESGDSNWQSYINGDSERVKTFDEQFAPYRQTLDNFYEKYKGTKTCDAVIAKINEYINDPYAGDIKTLVDELREMIMSAEDLEDLESDCIFESEEATETEVKDVVDDDILTAETVEAVLTADDDVKDETVTAVVDAVKDDAKEGEEISLDDVVDATVDAELSKEEATAVIDAVVDAVVDQKVEDETVNESKKYSLKKAVKESLHKKFRKGVFEARVRRIRNKKK